MPEIAGIIQDGAPPQIRRESIPDNPSLAQACEPALARASEPRLTTTIRAPTLSLATLTHAIGDLIDYRDLLYTLSVHRLKVRYKQSVLGPTWRLSSHCCSC